MAADRTGWPELLKGLAASLSELAKAELGALQGDLKGSSRQLAFAIAWFVAAASFLFWGLAVMTWAAVEGLAVVWPRWLAAVSVGGLLFLICGVLVLLGKARLKRFEAPARTVTRRLAEHRDWWSLQVLEVDPASHGDSAEGESAE